MKSLLDIQQDIRNLENNIKGIADHIKTISSDIEEMRNSTQDVDVDYSKIEILAKQIYFYIHPLNQLDDGRVCQIYLEMLLNITKLDADPEATVNRLVFIQWLQMQSRIDWTLEDLYKDCFKMDKESYDEFADVIPSKYREYFMVDALIIANICGSMNREVMEYIASLSVVLGIGKEELRVLSSISRMALSQSVSGIHRDEMYHVQKYINNYRHYLNDDIVEQGMSALRDVVVEIADNSAMDFKWKVKQTPIVEKGDVIATYKRGIKSKVYSWITEYQIEEIVATSSGRLFRFRDNSILYGVISNEEDNVGAIQAWIKGRR